MDSTQLAQIALQLIAQVSIKADDRDLAAVQAVRNMLRRIASGDLVVGAPVKAESKSEGTPP